MDRVEAITRALELIGEARAKVYGTSPAAWDFLFRVTRYLGEQHKLAFAETFHCHLTEGQQ